MPDLNMRYICKNGHELNYFDYSESKQTRICAECGAAMANLKINCVDCGKERVVTSRGANVRRCEKCQKKHRTNREKKHYHDNAADIQQRRRELKKLAIKKNKIIIEKKPDCKYYQDCLDNTAYKNEEFSCKDCKRYEKFNDTVLNHIHYESFGNYVDGI